MPRVYITTPIYYVNDRPHIGHCYTTLVADIAARMARQRLGDDKAVFFLTGTDEHADRVVTRAVENSMTPLQWADRNAAEFVRAFRFLNFSNDDFVRTTQDRHKRKVHEYIRALQKTGDVYLGDYVGWYDESQDEYKTEMEAKELNFASPVTGKPLVRRVEKNYFFNLPKYAPALKAHLDANPAFVSPEGRRNEVLGRLRAGLNPVPISRAVTDDPTTRWGIMMPDDPTHRIYVWIDALFNYLSIVDTPERAEFWPPVTHWMAKDILWFHAVIWPCLLMALERPLPRAVYAHSYWVREGRKMSKSLGNFVTIEVLAGYAARYGIDAVRWYLTTQGPLGAADADFSHAKFVETYNADLANGIGNCASRVANMIAKYFNGAVPDHGGALAAPGCDWPALARGASERALKCADELDLRGSLDAATDLIRRVDAYINETRPFSLAKEIDADPAAAAPKRARLAAILYQCAEAVRIASLLYTPAMPQKMGALRELWGCRPPAGVPLDALAVFGGAHGLKPGAPIQKGEALFMRADPDEAPPGEVELPAAV